MKRKYKLLLSLLCGFMLTGCSWIDSKIKDFKGELIGNSFNISVYDNFGSNILNVNGTKVGLEANRMEVIGYDSDGTVSTSYEMSSVITNTIDGNKMDIVGNTVIYAETGLKELVDFELPNNIHTNGGNFNLLDRNINKIKNLLGTSKVVIVSSQLGVPIAVYGGEKVYTEIPDDLPKMTKANIDGKALYVHRANIIVLDTNMIL